MQIIDISKESYNVLSEIYNFAFYEFIYIRDCIFAGI